MKIRPVILCGGAGTRLWPNSKKHQVKQFINFGDWTLLDKTLERIKYSIFDEPIISTNLKYLKLIKEHLKKHRIKKYKIVLEPVKKNTASAILSATLINDIEHHQPLIFFSADHLLEKTKVLNKALKINRKKLNEKNIFIFGIKPKNPSTEYGYFSSKKNNNNTYKVLNFIEKPKIQKAKLIIKKGGYWNSGMFFMRKDSIINNFKKYQKHLYFNCLKAVSKARYKKNIYYLNKKSFSKTPAISFDYAILEKTKEINAIKLDIPWSDLGSWKEICKMYDKNKKKYFNKKNIFYRPWGKYVNLFKGKEFLIKEIYIKPKGILSLQKHFHRAEHWIVTQGIPKITLNNKSFTKKIDDHIFIPQGAIHRIENPYTKPVKIIEAQLGLILKETDIVRYKDIYGRIR
ncbi:MAG: mannose-6-phosphate isomerase [Candidatus Pelagibacter sp. TMED153]|nr:MAG: mannose-6-phosphate isomerase [Candidatus Pelagibacter sp. TMED153]